MAFKLSEGAIMRMYSENRDENENPLLQVLDLKIVQAQQKDNTKTVRYRLLLSDGSRFQQGMLATQLNELVISGKLQKGSVIQLTQFICSNVQNRTIIIIVDLNVVVDKCDVIGKPEGMPFMSKQSPMCQSEVSVGNAQNVGCSSPVSNIPVRPNIDGSFADHRRRNQPQGNVHSGSFDSVRYATSTASPSHPNADISSAFPRLEPSRGSYANQNTSFGYPQSEAPCPPLNSYPRPPQPAYQQPSPSPIYNNRGPMAKNEAPLRIIPIAALNPYQNMWTLKARVTAKGELRLYNNARGDGKVFSFDLLDSDGGEIRVTCFNSVADRFYNQIESGKVYFISRGSIKPAQKNFNHLPNDQEIYLDNTSIIQPCFDDDNSIPRQNFHFRPISVIEILENNSVVDVIGVVTFISPTASIMRKNGTETQKRSLHLKDSSGRSVELTLWGNFCNAEGHNLQSMCDSGLSPVLVVKAARVNDFNGKAVGTIATSQLLIEPEIPEVRSLKEWYEREGKHVQSISISREISSVSRTESRKTISQIKDEKLGTSEKPDWIVVSASVAFIKVDNFCYTACPLMVGDRQCNKKVTNNGDGKWRCDRCDQSVDLCDYRYILQIQIQDHTGLTWATAFQECGEEILGISAKDLYYLKYEEQDDEKFAEIIRKVLFTKYIFKLKVKEEIFSDEQRVKSTVVKAERVNFSSESKSLLDSIEKLNAERAGNLNPNSVKNDVNWGLDNVGGWQSVHPVYNSNNIAGRNYTVPANQTGPCGSSYTSSVTTAGGTSSAGIGGSTGECFKCHQMGHWAKDCPGFNTLPPAYGNAGVVSDRFGSF